MKVYFNKSVQTFLEEAFKTVKSPIAYFILNKSIETNISFLDVMEDDRLIVTPEVKIVKTYNESVKDKLNYKDYLENLQADKTSIGYTKNRIEIKMGRFLKKVIEENRGYWDKFIIRYRESYSEKRTEDELIEELVLQYRVATKKIFDKAFDSRIEKVTGNEIRKWYFEGNYKQGKGSLHASCMRYEKCNSYFEIYEKNSEVCSMLVYKDSIDKISMRAILWKIDGNMYLDRIYAADDADKTIFINYAKRNGWIAFDTHKGSLPADLKVKLKDINYERFPYMDTFQFYDRKNKVVSFSKIGSDTVKLTTQTGAYTN